MFSATLPPEIHSLSKKFLKHYAYVQIGDLGSAKKEITQRIEYVNGGLKLKHRILGKLLDKCQNQSTIIFMNQKLDTETLSQFICKEIGLKAVCMHGSLPQAKREQALDLFSQKKVGIMVCTNVAARGIDIDDIQHVINFDAPFTLTDYIHRIGRTGRAGKKGNAVTLLTPEDSSIFFDLRKYLVEND